MWNEKIHGFSPVETLGMQGTRYWLAFTGKKSTCSPVDPKYNKIIAEALAAHLLAMMIECQVFPNCEGFQYLQANTRKKAAWFSSNEQDYRVFLLQPLERGIGAYG